MSSNLYKHVNNLFTLLHITHNGVKYHCNKQQENSTHRSISTSEQKSFSSVYFRKPHNELAWCGGGALCTTVLDIHVIMTQVQHPHMAMAFSTSLV